MNEPDPDPGPAAAPEAGTAVVWHAHCPGLDVAGTRAAHRELVRQVLSASTGIPAARLPIVVDPGGKPRLDLPQAPTGPLHFNVTHSGEHLLVACSAAGPVGVDAEQARRLDTDGVARRALAPRERRAFAALPADQRGAVLLRVWTRKEALLKAEGVGLGRAPSSLEVEFDRPARPARTLAHSGGWPWQLYDISPPDDLGPAGPLTAALVTTGPARVVHRRWSSRPDGSSRPEWAADRSRSALR